MSVEVSTSAPRAAAIQPVGRSFRAISLDIVLFAICVCLISVQIFVHPFIGMADNGDFPKVLGPLSLYPAADVHLKAYVVPLFRRAQMYRWKTPVFSSEVYFGRLAVGISRLFGNYKQFDIRYVGAVHASVFLIALATLIIALRRRSWTFRLPLLAFVIWVFTDVAYVAYYNTFYADAAAVVSLFAALAFALVITTQSRLHWVLLVLFVIASLLFITSKGQHGILGFLPAAFLVWISWSWRRAARVFAISLAAIVLAATALEVFWLTPAWYRGAAAYDVVFYQIPRMSSDPAKDLQSLGVPPEDHRYLGTWAALDDVRTREWFADFSRQVTPFKLFKLYVHHPQLAAAMTHQALLDASHIRAGIGNFCFGDGFPPFAITQRFASWGALRAKVFRAWPLHILVWYIVAFSTGLYLAARGRSLLTRRAATICAAILVMGVVEFFISSLGDAVETDRHLFLFQTCTDISICFAVAAALDFVNLQFRSRPTLNPTKTFHASPQS